MTPKHLTSYVNATLEIVTWKWIESHDSRIQSTWWPPSLWLIRLIFQTRKKQFSESSPEFLSKNAINDHVNATIQCEKQVWNWHKKIGMGSIFSICFSFHCNYCGKNIAKEKCSNDYHHLFGHLKFSISKFLGCISDSSVSYWFL